MARTRSRGNPFRIHGVATGEAFADRLDEVARLEAVLTDPGTKLMMYGPRRMGKTSVVLRAIEHVQSEGGHALFADLSTASSATDASNRILAAAGAALGRSLRDFVTDLVGKLKLSVTLTADPATGLILPGLDLQARDWDAARQQQTLADVLDALNAMAKKRKTCIGIALDEFQEITRFGGDQMEWQLRGVMQRHHHLAYVLAGSREHLIERMTASAGAFYKMVDKMRFGPIDPAELASWIDRRFRASGIESNDAGSEIVRAAGPRTRDIMQLARVCHDRTRGTGRVSPGDITPAMREIVAEEHDLYHSAWRGLTALQQNVLRAVAAAEGGLTSKPVLRAFSLGSSGAVIHAVRALVSAGLLTRIDAYSGARVSTPTGYAYDSPYFHAWVWWNALADMGPSRESLVRERPHAYPMPKENDIPSNSSE